MTSRKFVFAALTCITMLFSAPALSAIGPAGHWALKAEGRVLSTLSISPGPSEGSWIGTLSRPANVDSFRGSFYNISGPVSDWRVSGMAHGQDKLELRIGASPGTSGDTTFLFQLVDRDHAALEPSGAGVEAWMLTRTAAAQNVSKDWAPKQMYDGDADWPSNPEMTRIFDEDQSVRQNPTTINWTIVSRSDDVRRQRTKHLLDAGKLRSGDDYYQAAFIFQHGDKPDDYLMAHTLATIAAARGKRDATWIAAATLDRYLQNIGQHQIYGTQYRGTPGGGLTLDPYDKMLMSDALRAAMGVPPLADQERKTMQAAPKR